MKLLLDENLSPTLVRHLSAAYSESRHVSDVGLAGATDLQIWAFAQEQGYVLVSKDSDFRELSTARGAPPKVVWLVVGNEGTLAIRDLLVATQDRLEALVADSEEALLVLSLLDA